MAKKNKSKNKQKQKLKTERESPKTPQQAHQKNKPISIRYLYRYWSYAWGILGPLLTIIALYYTFYPSISVVPANGFNANNPFEIPFTIKNENIYPITLTKVVFKNERLLFTNNSDFLGGDFLGYPDPPIVVESKNETTQVFIFNKLFKTAPLRYGSIAISITYDPPWFYPPKREFIQKYKTYNVEGKLYWVSN